MSGPSLGGGPWPTSWSTRLVGSWAHCVLAPNPGPMTLDGTNTWVLHEPGTPDAVVVDPGPEHAGHQGAVLDAVRARGARVRQVLLTHGHADHSEGAASFAQRAGADGVRALDPRHRLGSEGLADGDVVPVGGGELHVVATPGHTSDSLSFRLVGPPEVPAALLTGDTVLGRGTTVVAHPDGRLGPYLDSLRRLRDLASSAGATAVWPGHGPVLDDALAAVEGYLAHREQRLEQVRDAVDAGCVTPRAVVERVYADVDPVLWPAAELSVRAQLEYLGV
ncbi:MBL fold metallo-hydrolase [Thalassiella azotivora]